RTYAYRAPMSALDQKRTSALVLHFKDGFVLIHDHYAKQPERRRTDYLPAVPMLALNILGIASFHNVIRLPFNLCGPFAGNDQMEFIPVMKVKRNHATGRDFVDICDDLLVRDTSQIYFDQSRDLVSGKAGLVLR